MRLYLPLFFALLLTSLLRAESDSSVQPKFRFSQKELVQGYRENTLIVRQAKHVDPDALEQEETRKGLFTKKRFSHLNGMRVVHVPEGQSLETVKKTLEASGEYDVVARDDIRTIYTTPNDTNFSSQWSLNNTGASGAKSGADIDAVTAWSTRSSASNVIVAVIDSGIRLDHPDIVANLWTNPGETAGDGVDNDRDGYIDDVHGIDATIDSSNALAGTPTDEAGHGTHVAGIIGAVGNNNSGISGVAWSVQIMALKFIDSTGKGSTDDAITCINYAIAKKANIINASYGTEQGQSYYNYAEIAAIQAARAAGIIFVAAAGNDTQNLDVEKTYPASYAIDNIVTVGSSTNLDDPSTFSNYGSGSCDLFAPGEAILSLSYSYLKPADRYVYMSGTSMAAPHVAGALALLKAQFPTDTYRGLINRLLRSTENLTSLKGLCQTNGRLNLANAITSTDNRPFNDDFAARSKIYGNNITVRACNTLGSREASEPVHAGSTGTSSLWWEWTAPATTMATIDTEGSSFDTLLAVYTGDSLGSLTSVASNNDAAGGVLTSRVSFNATAGVSYKIAVDSKNALTGLIVLNVGGVPIHDSFASPRVLEGLSTVVEDLNSSASAEAGEPSILNVSGGRSLWYSWKAPVDHHYQLAVTTTSFTALAAIYTGQSLGGLTLVTAAKAADDSGLRCDFEAKAGTSYHFVVNTTNSTNTGQFVLSLTDSLWQYPSNGAVTNSPAVNSDGTVYFADSTDSVYSLTASGALRWKRAIGHGVDSSTLSIDASGNLICPSIDGIVYCISASNTLLWQRDLGAMIHNSPAIGSDGVIYIKDDKGLVQALQGSSGVVKWTFNTLASESYAGPALSTDGHVYVGDGAGVMHSLVASTGAEVWTYAADAAIYTSAAIDAAGNLYFATTGGTVYSLTKSGSLRWSTNFVSSITCSPVLAADGTVYVAGYDNKLHALKGDTGVERWSYPLGGQVRASSPAVADDGTVYIGCYDKLLYAIKSDGTLSRVYATNSIIRSAPAISGTRLYVGSNDMKLYAFDIGHGAAGSDWPMKGFNAARIGRYVSGTPRITTDLEAVTAIIGRSYSLSVAATGTDLTFAWYKNDVKIAGATSATLSFASIAAADAGTYRAVVSNNLGSVSSTTVTVAPVLGVPGRITNMSVRALSEGAGNPLTVGFSISGGSTAKPVLIRGLGATLIKSFSIADGIPDPEMKLFQSLGSTNVFEYSNLNWGGTSALLQAFNTFTGWSDLDAKDPALLVSLTGTHSAQIFDSNGASGVSMGELYDADTTQGENPATGRLVNISARAMVRSGNQIIVAGFIINGNVPMKLLIRAVGPSLANYGVSPVLAHPRIDLYKGNPQVLIKSNQVWGGEAAILDAAAKVGAFSLSSGASLDSAMLVTLAPDSYTAQVVSADGQPGIALVEVYVVPE